MLFDHRTYHVRPGTVSMQLAMYEKYGWEPQKRHLGEPLAFMVTETGDLNSYVHIWVYEDAGDRARKRAALAQDADWKIYLEHSAKAGYLIGQENNHMTPVSFLKHRVGP
ncbi:hypothetical protein BH09PSE5_BH09PSE5_07790 [soil metagenome]